MKLLSPFSEIPFFACILLSPCHIMYLKKKEEKEQYLHKPASMSKDTNLSARAWVASLGLHP